MGACLLTLWLHVVIDKWIFTHKFLSDGTFNCYKSRWVLRGFTECLGVD
jgi:hypothetical protein